MKKIFIFVCLFNFLIAPLMAKGISLQGELIVQDPPYKASFRLIKKNNGHYLLRISPQSSKNFCDFTVRRISAPQQTRGMKGHLFTNRPTLCKFHLSSQEQTLFWNTIELIDLSYRFIGPNTFGGVAKLNSLQRSYRAHLKFK